MTDTQGVPAALPARNRWRGMLALAAVALVILVCVAYPPLREGIRQAWGNAFYPKELASVRFIASTGGTTALYERSGAAFVPHVATDAGPLPPELFASDERDANVSVIRMGAFTALAVDGAQVYASASEKSTVDRSPDMRRFAFTEAGGEPGAPRAMVLDRETGTQTELGTGFAPFFLDDARVLWFAADGVRMTDIRSGAIAVLEGTPAASAPLPVMSPDRTLAAWVDASGALRLARLEGDALTTLATYADLPVNARLGLTDTALYVLAPAAKGTDVYRYPLDGGKPKRIYRFDTQWTIMQFIP